jgi:periplasmic copper chaperone A
MSKPTALALAMAGVLFASGRADAHISPTGPAIANKSQEVTLNIPHGCELVDGDGTHHLDTSSVRIEIPDGVTGVRPLRSDFGPTTVARTGDVVTSVTWTKKEGDILADDVAHYRLTIRLKTPDRPLKQLTLRVHQTCSSPDGRKTQTLDWIDGPSGEHPAAVLTLVPDRVPGWNRYVIGADVHLSDTDFETYFKDAQILWRGTAAWSANAATRTQIGATAGVTVLAGGLHPDDEIWVKY